jgi:hypothetical protein
MPPPFRARELHTSADIQLSMRALLATHESTRRMFRETPEADAYSAGFREAMLLLAEALNVHLGIPTAAHYLER